MHQRLRVFFPFLAVMLILFFSGCGKPIAEGTDTLRLAFSNKIQYLPLIIACDQESAGSGASLITPVIGTGGIDAAEALLAGEADIGAMGDVPALILLSKNTRFQVICAFMQSPTMHRLVGSTACGVRTIHDLAGKRVAVHHGSSTHGALLAYLQENGIDPAAIELVPLAPVNFPEAMLHGDVDAVAGSEPWPQNVLDRVPASIPIATLTVAGNSFPHVLVADRDFIDRRREKVIKFLDELGNITVGIRKAPDAAAAVAARFTGRSPAGEMLAMKELLFQLDFSPNVGKGLKKSAAFLLDRKKINSMPDATVLEPVAGLRP